jgi:hypothetical protein
MGLVAGWQPAGVEETVVEFGAGATAFNRTRGSSNPIGNLPGGRRWRGPHDDCHIAQVGRGGAMAALRRARPGQRMVSVAKASELANLRSEVHRLGSVLIHQAVELAVRR